MENADAIVIGSGVIGSSVAYNLAKRECDVLTLEEKSLGCWETLRPPLLILPALIWDR